jgi:hypothetical protein
LVLPAEASIDPGRLAWLPLTFLAEQELQSDAGVTGYDDLYAYREVMKAGSRLYQLYSYLGMVRRRFGDQVAQQVRALQCGVLDNDQPGAGKTVDTALQLIEHSLSAAVAGPENASTELPLPAEQYVALALLTSLPESPDYQPGMHNICWPPQSMMGAVQQLSGLRVKARQELLRAFSPLLNSTYSI